MRERTSWQFSKLQSELAWLAAGALTVAAFIGAAIAVVLDVLWHRHRRA